MRRLGIISLVMISSIVCPCFASEPDNQSAELRSLGRDLAAFEIKTWRVVGKYWDQPTVCLDIIDQHMNEHRNRVLGVLESYGATSCRIDSDGLWIVGSGNAERDREFMAAFTKRMARTTELRQSFLDDPPMRELARTVIAREREFRESVCKEYTITHSEDGEQVDS